MNLKKNKTNPFKIGDLVVFDYEEAINLVRSAFVRMTELNNNLAFQFTVVEVRGEVVEITGNYDFHYSFLNFANER